MLVFLLSVEHLSFRHFLFVLSYDNAINLNGAKLGLIFLMPNSDAQCIIIILVIILDVVLVHLTILVSLWRLI